MRLIIFLSQASLKLSTGASYHEAFRKQRHITPLSNVHAHNIISSKIPFQSVHRSFCTYPCKSPKETFFRALLALDFCLPASFRYSEPKGRFLDLACQSTPPQSFCSTSTSPSPQHRFSQINPVSLTWPVLWLLTTLFPVFAFSPHLMLSSLSHLPQRPVTSGTSKRHHYQVFAYRSCS